MHINWRRGEDRVFVGLREGGPCSANQESRRDSFAWAKRQAWSERRMREREAIHRGDEVPRWRRHIRWDLW